jgi:uncharacterized protein
MKLLFDLNHPAHFHLFHYVVKELSLRHEVLITAKKKDVLLDLLSKTDFNYKVLETKERKSGLIHSGINLLKRDIKMLSVVKQFKPDLLLGTSISISHVGRLKGIPSLYFGEDGYESVPLSHMIGYPFATHLITPDVTSVGKFSSKQVSYKGYHELAYLAPNHYSPDKSIYGELGLKEGERYSLLRFSALNAHHDVGIGGINTPLAEKLISSMEKHGKVFITTEKELGKKLNPFRMSIPADRIHHAMYYADIYVGDSQTMAAEAAVLGTPSFRVNEHVDKNVGYLMELEKKYKLTFGLQPSESKLLLNKVDEVLNDSNTSEKWQQRRQKMLNEKIDVASFFVDLIENYPDSTKNT